MKKMSIIACFLFACLLPLTSMAQQQSRFIELTVADTIVLKATQIVYQISIGKQTEFAGINFGSDEEETAQDLPTIKDVTGMLDKKKFKYTVVSNKDYSVSEKDAKPTVEVAVANETELNKLYELVKNEKGLTGKIKEVKYEDVVKNSEAEYKKLYAKALQQATYMAAVSGDKVGKLISVSNVMNEAFNFMSIYKQLMKNIPKLGFGEAPSFQNEEVVKMVFKFELQ